MFFLLFFLPYIHGDCLEFINTSLINKCLIITGKPSNKTDDHYYPQCLQCTIIIESDDIQLENANQCLTIELQCILLKFSTKEIFENFFQFHQKILYNLFFKNNGTDQNTLHIIIKNNTLNEINAQYIEEIFRLDHYAYRVLIFELYIQNNMIIQINRNLMDISSLSIKLILVCSDEYQRKETIYLIHNRNITLESQYDPCSPIFIPSTTSTTSTNEVLSISHEKSKNIVLIIILLTTFLICLCIILIIYCLKRIKHHYRRLSKTIDSTSELSTSQDETPLTPSPNQPKLKRPLRGVRALQLLDDDV